MTEYVRLLFDSAWELYSIKWPGFGFSIGAAFMTVAFAVTGLRVLGRMLGVNFENKGDVRGGNNRKIKVSDDRAGDEK